jgi:sulfur carrier protein
MTRESLNMDDTTATIRVNGEPEMLAAATIAALLDEMEIDARGVAVALNGAVVPRAAWRETRLSPGDAVEIVRARQGG